MYVQLEKGWKKTWKDRMTSHRNPQKCTYTNGVALYLANYSCRSALALPGGASMVLHLHLTDIIKATKYNCGYPSMTSFGIFAFTWRPSKLNTLMAYLLLHQQNHGESQRTCRFTRKQKVDWAVLPSLHCMLSLFLQQSEQLKKYSAYQKKPLKLSKEHFSSRKLRDAAQRTNALRCLLRC